jgi:drug/metabolite transporter (DMT)-like permease
MMTARAVNSISHWHVPALGFFATGFLAGAALVLLATIPGIRGMGYVAVTSSVLGMAMVCYALRMEDPETWAVITDPCRSMAAASVSPWAALWARRRTFDRYLQGVAWTGMR